MKNEWMEFNRPQGGKAYHTTTAADYIPLHPVLFLYYLDISYFKPKPGPS